MKLTIARWASEAAGACAITVGLWWEVMPLAGIVFGGAYLIGLAHYPVRIPWGGES